MDNKFRESGTLGSNYAEEGPYHCADCIHRTASDSQFCIHPLVVSDPDMQDRLVQIEGQSAIQIDKEKGCCRYVKPPSVIALVMRHGDTQLNEEGRLRSRMDVPLDDKGLQQAQEGAQFILQNYPPVKHIYVAPLTRAMQTAEPIARALGLQPEPVEGLNTWDMGILIGQKKDESKDILEHFIRNSAEPIPDGESLQEHVAGMQSAIEMILDEAEEDGPVLIVMTSSSIIPLLKLVEGTPIEEKTDSDGVGPGGIFTITLEGDGFKMEPVFGEPKPAEVGAS